MEVAIYALTGRDPKTNSQAANGLNAGDKKGVLVKLLTAKGETAKIAAVNKVFDVSDRNGWVHGHILNPGGDFQQMTRLRIEIDKRTKTIKTVTNSPIDYVRPPFQDFYDAYEECMRALGVSIERSSRPTPTCERSKRRSAGQRTSSPSCRPRSSTQQPDSVIIACAARC